MGIRFNEIEPVFELDQNDTRELARFLCSKRDAAERISFDDFSTALREYNMSGQEYGVRCRQENTFDRTVEALKEAKWIEESADKTGFVFTERALSTSSAINGPRMTFAEACAQIQNLRDRLNNAPHNINGVTVNSVLLYGSALRDNNKQETIGDLDLIVDMSFDNRFKNATVAQRTEAARQAWAPVISKGDERLGFFPGIEPMSYALVTASQETWAMERPHVLMQIWANENPMSSSLSSAEANAIAILEERTIRTQTRARIIHHIIKSDTASIQPDLRTDLLRVTTVPSPLPR